MKKYSFLSFAVLISMLLASCDKDKWYQVPSETSDYVERFEAMAENRGYDIDIEERGLIIEFGSIEESLNSKLYYEDPIRIVIDKTAWNNFNDELKALEIYRNLALGFLNRQTLNDKFPNGEWKSLMRGEVFEEGDTQNLNFFGFRQEYYINEMFYLEAETPWWADYEASYDSIRMQGANDILSQDIPLDELEWGYTSAGLNVGFENGELILNNLNADSKIIITQLEEQLTADFLIEAIIKIDDSEAFNFSGLIWGASGNNAFYVNTYNLENESKMYNASEKYHYCHFTEENCTQIDPEGYNKISIRKEGDRYHYFINESFVYMTDIHEFYGNQFGFYIGGESKIYINRLSIKSE
ncbi:MAG: hypothetical protein PF448_00325 [Bacteroidales bacterium]|jgi:hypothetical protein|nr:hypothetical protein [Bacteroidales bacterium]